MGPAVKPYTELDGFENVYLEESYVLAIEARPGTVSFELEVVLTPEHPEYAPPPLGIFACYREGRLDFEGVTYLEWSGQGSPPISDPSGKPDYGQIDAFGWDQSMFELEGEWGAMKISAASVRIALHDGGDV